MQTPIATRPVPKTTSAVDIVFRCEHCNTSLVVNRAAAGMKFNCQECGKPITVPKPEAPVLDPKSRVQEVESSLVENNSQRTEITGYINQSSIQLHRWQLRLQMLNERKEELEKELASLKP